MAMTVDGIWKVLGRGFDTPTSTTARQSLRNLAHASVANVGIAVGF